MLSVVPAPERKKRGCCYETLVAECVDLIAAGKARFASDAAWLVCRNHPDDEINVLTLENYTRLARRFRVEPSKESVTG